jgi:hypothetical protein
MATEIDIYGKRVTLERVYTKADRQYGFKSSPDYAPEYEKSTEYEVLIDGKTAGYVFAYETQNEHFASTGNHVAWRSKPRKTWGYFMPGELRGTVWLSTRRDAVERLVGEHVQES